MAQPDPEPHLGLQIPAPPLVESQNVSTPFGMTSAPLPTPSPVPTAPPLELHNVGRHVESVTMTGHPVHNAGAEQLGVLHIGEAIRYSDGTLDIVGYFPVGSSPLGNGDPMFVERYEQDPTKNSAQTPEQYVAEAKQHFTLPVYPIPKRRSISSLRRKQRRGKPTTPATGRRDTISAARCCTIRTARWSVR